MNSSDQIDPEPEGADYLPKDVKQELLSAESGDIIILHMNRSNAGTYGGVQKAIPELI